MAAVLTTLRTRADRLRQDQGAELRQLVLSIGGLPDHAVGQIVAAIDRETVSSNGWTFVMISPAQNAAVVNWLVKNSERPMQAVTLWAECFVCLRRDTGEVMLTRDELAEKTKIPANHVSGIMSELEGCGAIIRRRELVPGMRGRGKARYFMNPRVATHLAGASRDNAQSEAPDLFGQQTA